MGQTLTFEQQLQRLRRKEREIEKAIRNTARDATIKAVEAATDATPPNGDGLRGTNAISGELKQHWATDSKMQPRRTGDMISTELKNNLQYASYVNDGHRMDRHFVPGLYINESSGMLEYSPGADVGIVVGTRTNYVEGVFMTEEGVREYEKVIEVELDRRIQEVLRD